MKESGEDIGVGKRSAEIRFAVLWLILISTVVAIGYAMYCGFLTREAIQSWVESSNGRAPVICVVVASVRIADLFIFDSFPVRSDYLYSRVKEHGGILNHSA